MAFVDPLRSVWLMLIFHRNCDGKDTSREMNLEGEDVEKEGLDIVFSMGFGVTDTQRKTSVEKGAPLPHDENPRSSNFKEQRPLW